MTACPMCGAEAPADARLSSALAQRLGVTRPAADRILATVSLKEAQRLRRQLRVGQR